MPKEREPYVEHPPLILDPEKKLPSSTPTIIIHQFKKFGKLFKLCISNPTSMMGLTIK